MFSVLVFHIFCSAEVLVHILAKLVLMITAVFCLGEEEFSFISKVVRPEIICKRGGPHCWGDAVHLEGTKCVLTPSGFAPFGRRGWASRCQVVCPTAARGLGLQQQVLIEIRKLNFRNEWNLEKLLILQLESKTQRPGSLAVCPGTSACAE